MVNTAKTDMVDFSRETNRRTSLDTELKNENRIISLKYIDQSKKLKIMHQNFDFNTSRNIKIKN